MRRDGSLHTIGRVADVPDDVSPLQLGTLGHDGDDRFELIGRTRWRWSGGGWSEWLMLYGEGTHGWLAEAMGRFMLMQEVVDPVAAQPFQHLRSSSNLGQEVSFGGRVFTLADIKEAVCVGSEGELPFTTRAGQTVRNLDFVSDDGACANMQTVDGVTSVYVGRYVTLEALRPERLRLIDGWRKPSFAA